MALRPVVSAITEVPEPFRSEYEERDGKFVLKLEGDAIPGFVPAATHAQFRDTNVRLLKALGADTVDAAMSKVALFTGIDATKLAELKDIDPAEYRALKAKVEALEKKGVTKPDDIQAAIQAALEGFKATTLKPLQDKLTASDEREKAKDERLAEAKIREAVAQRFTKAGGRSDAGILDFILSRAREAFRVVDDRVTAAEGRFGTNGDPLTVDEWIAGATKEHAFAFEPSKGGGATGGAGGGSATRPGVRRVLNPSSQELGEFKFVPGKGLVDRTGVVVEIVSQ